MAKSEKWLDSKRKRNRDIRDFIAVHGKIVKAPPPHVSSPPPSSGEGEGKKRRQLHLSRRHAQRRERQRDENKIPASVFSKGVRRKAPLRESQVANTSENSSSSSSCSSEVGENTSTTVAERVSTGKENDCVTASVKVPTTAGCPLRGAEREGTREKSSCHTAKACSFKAADRVGIGKEVSLEATKKKVTGFTNTRCPLKDSTQSFGTKPIRKKTASRVPSGIIPLFLQDSNHVTTPPRFPPITLGTVSSPDILELDDFHADPKSKFTISPPPSSTCGTSKVRTNDVTLDKRGNLCAGDKEIDKVEKALKVSPGTPPLFSDHSSPLWGDFPAALTGLTGTSPASAAVSWDTDELLAELSSCERLCDEILRTY